MYMIKKYLYYGALGLFVYMPFHIFLSQWSSTFTGGLDIWKVAKDVFAAALVSALVLIVLYQRLYTRLYLSLLGLAILYLMIHLVLFATTHQPTETGLLGTTYNNRLIWFVLIGYSLALIYPTKHLHNRFAKIIIGLAVVVSLLALAQWLLPKDIMTHFGYSIDRGVKPNFFIDDKPNLPRVFSTLRDPNSLGAFLLLPSTLIITALFRYWRTSKRTLLLGIQGLLGLTVFLTFSRSAFVAVLLAHATVLSYLLRKRVVVLVKNFAIPLLLLLVGLGVAGYLLRDQYVVQNVVFHADESTQQADSNELHAYYIKKGIDGIEQHPEGQGPGTAGIVSTKLPSGLLTENYFIQVGYEVGLLGLGIFLVFLGMIVNTLWRVRNGIVPIGLLGAFVGLVFMNMLLHTWSNEAVAASWFILAGLTLPQASKE